MTTRYWKDWPKTIDNNCGCEYTLEVKDGKIAYYYVSSLCAEHDPSV